MLRLRSWKLYFVFGRGIVCKRLELGKTDSIGKMQINDWERDLRGKTIPHKNKTKLSNAEVEAAAEGFVMDWPLHY